MLFPLAIIQGNSAHQQISLLAHNLVLNFQIETDLLDERTAKRAHIFFFSSLKTIKFELIQAAGRILNTPKYTKG